MAKQKPIQPTSSSIANALDEMRKKKEEETRTKGYAEILDYANKFNDFQGIQENGTPRFPQPATISAQDTTAPYYGSDAEKQQLAAMEYAKALQQQENALVKVNPEYYDQLKKQIPVINAEVIPHYNVTKDRMVLPLPISYATALADMQQSQLDKNNYGTQKQLSSSLLNGLGNFYRDTIEHEAGHIADKQVEFAPGPAIALGTHNLSSVKNLGYMGKEDHLTTGLGKVQREWYSMTGKRFESPDEFKNFVFSLSSSKDPEEAISGFSEEAKRALRPQIENAKSVKEYYDELDAWKNKKGWFKGTEPLIKGNPDFLEKSAQLIPALVQEKSYNPYEGLPS
jgi:hypothetical protein